MLQYAGYVRLSWYILKKLKARPEYTIKIMHSGRAIEFIKLKVYKVLKVGKKAFTLWTLWTLWTL